MHKENETPLSIRTFPRAILHIDGDSFFAACEQAMHREYQGKPVVVGGERGLATAMSKEAKACGVKRGMQTHEVKKLCPECIIVSSDYETYSLFSLRMFEIVRRYTPSVEEYSIDECFADLTGLRSYFQKPYEEIAKSIKKDLVEELGLSFSAGLAPSKVLAKVATGWDKPDGFAVIPGRDIHHFLKDMPIEDVWGIGANTSEYMRKCGVKTALSFARMNDAWVKERFSKPYQEIWRELRGESVMPVETEKKAPKSVNKTKTFSPPSGDRAFVRSQLSKNIENATIRMRRHGLFTDRVTLILRKKNFESVGREIRLSVRTNAPSAIWGACTEAFEALFEEGVYYRATGVGLSNLTSEESIQHDLFSGSVRAEKLSKVFKVVDAIDGKFGKHTVYLGGSARAIQDGVAFGKRGVEARRKTETLGGESKRKHINLPYLGAVK